MPNESAAAAAAAAAPAPAPAAAAAAAAAAAGARTPTGETNLLVASADESLLDVVDNLLNRGVVLHGDVVLALADVDLIYLRLSVLLCAADRILPSS